MKQLPSHYLKIAVHAHNSIDAMELLCWAYKINKEDPRLIAISMGPHGQISRILAPLIGSPITYAALDDEGATAPGQITAQTLVERYNYRSIRHCSIYGLIGDPIEQSISDVTHNALMQKMHLNGVYIKIQVTPSELPRLLQLARTLSFRGLSVTMPLKELVIAYIDHIDSEAAAIGAVNTLVFDERGISGFNTDGIGALNAIGGSVKGKHMVIIGAGGAAKAIAYEAKKRGVHVTIVNRSIEKAKQLAATFDCSYGGLEEMSRLAESSYDILINSTPLPLPIDPQYILSKATVMDIKTKPQINPFIQHALDKGSHVIYGYQMFVEQAVGQFQLWYTDRIDQTTCRKSLAISVKTQLLA